MQDEPQLHSSIVAMVSLASGIAANHPEMGQCQLDRLRQAGVPQHQIDTVIEIARHIRNEAARKLDSAFDELAQADAGSNVDDGKALDIKVNGTACCTPTVSGQACC